ncbi:MAG: M16 family metallopeptidase [Candidatus Eisenbacteria bacterium]|nr:pitrilysin family protein [Candidatus Eisenbacteria bacterium]
MRRFWIRVPGIRAIPGTLGILGVLGILALLPAAHPAVAAKAQAKGQDGFAALEKQVETFTLPNGLTFLVLERHEAPIFGFRTYVDAGGVDEISGATGLAHMFEHMAFKGTTHVGTTDYAKERPALEAVDRAWEALKAERDKGRHADSTKIASLEAAFKAAQEEAGRYVVANEFGRVIEQNGGVGLNAGTGTDATQYMYDLPSNRAELWALMEGDRLTQPVLREFYKERDVVIEERRMRTESTPSGRLFEEFLTAAFLAHPYGKGVIGWRSDLETLSREEAEAFWKEHYVAKNMVIAVVGDVKAPEIRQLAEKYFSTVSDGPVPPPVHTVEPPQHVERTVVMEDEAQPLIFLGYHIPDFNDPDWFAYAALSDLLGEGRSSRLYTRLVKEAKVAVQAGTGAGFPGEKYPNLMFGFIVPATGVDPDSALAVFDDEVEKMFDEKPITQEELDGVKTRVRARFWQQIQSNQGMAGQLAYFQAMTGDYRNLFRQVEKVEAVTIDDVKRVARETLRKDNRTVAILRNRPAAGDAS